MQERFAKWETLREKGMWNYILTYGPLGWGVSIGILFTLTVYFVLRGEYAIPSGFLLAVSLALFPIGRIVWRGIMWFHFERVYRRASRPEPDAAADTDKPNG